MTQTRAAADTSAPPTARRRRVKRPIRRTPGTILAFLALGAASTVAVLVLAAGLYIFQDAYQAGHQATPKGAADAFLDAMLNKRSMDFASTYMCDDGRLARQTESVVGRIKRFEKENPGSSIKYLWGDFHTKHVSNARATVTTRVTASTTVDQSVINNPPQVWSLDMRDRGGWKVCGLSMP